MLIFLALAAYLATFYFFWRRISAVTGGSDTALNWGKAVPLGTGWMAALLHCLLLAQSMFHGTVLLLSFGHITSMVAVMTVLVFLLSTLTRDVMNLGLFVFPVGLIGLLAGIFLTGQPVPVENPPQILWWHLGIALVAFGFLCIAAAQALLLYLQDKQLHSHRPGSLLLSLPPIQTMENNLFRLTMIGAVLLTLNLLVGMIYLYYQEGRTLAFNHHILLSFIAWLGFLALLTGHRVYGWRGTVAARWTLSAFGILILSYFGSRFVTSFILS